MRLLMEQATAAAACVEGTSNGKLLLVEEEVVEGNRRRDRGLEGLNPGAAWWIGREAKRQTRVD